MIRVLDTYIYLLQSVVECETIALVMNLLTSSVFFWVDYTFFDVHAESRNYLAGKNALIPYFFSRGLCHYAPAIVDSSIIEFEYAAPINHVQEWFTCNDEGYDFGPENSSLNGLSGIHLQHINNNESETFVGDDEEINEWVVDEVFNLDKQVLIIAKQFARTSTHLMRIIY